jgi:chemotaxis protein MotA
MFTVLGILTVFLSIFGGYYLYGGKLSIILQVLPFELMIIGGGAFGALMMAVGPGGLKRLLQDAGKAVRGSKWSKNDYLDLLCVLFILLKIMKTKGTVVVEQHVERPEDSTIFQSYPGIMRDPTSVNLICDSIRLIGMGCHEAHELEEFIDTWVETKHRENMRVCEGPQAMADGLPAIGIVAAVLGVIKTMASITEPPEILGKMIGSALVGTFLGVFLSYCLVGPLAQRLRNAYQEEHQYGLVIKKILSAHLTNKQPIVSLEIGRNAIPTHIRPDFTELEGLMDEANKRASETS